MKLQTSLLPVLLLSLFAPSLVLAKSKEALLTEKLSNVTLSGFFTVTGKDKPPTKESYEILSVVKAPGKNDLWIFTSRIKKGDQTMDLPIPLPVKWAGDKPVIYMDNLKIPGLGQFSAFVLFDGNKYAGTWAHGKTTGHLYGTITKRSE
jgi:hypothetical protein